MKIYNNLILVKNTDPIVPRLKKLLTHTEESITSYNGIVTPVITTYENYYLNDNDELVIPRGYLDIILELSNDITNYEVKSIKDISFDFSKCKDILSSITLREDQVTAIKYMIEKRRGIIQLPTGSGKTEIISGFLKYLSFSLGYIPKTVILEPTTYLVTSTVSRLTKYDINSVDYSKIRKSSNKTINDFEVIVTHPKALLNDVSKDSKLLNKVVIFISDEGHHLQADTWNSLVTSLTSIEYSLALSASVIEGSKLSTVTNNIELINNLSYEEMLVLGATGNLLLNIPLSYYISSKVLATPILYNIENRLTEIIDPSDAKNWHKIRTTYLESDNRNYLISYISSILVKYKYKTLILAGTKENSYKLLNYLSKFNLDNVCRVSFGGGKFYKLFNDKIVDCTSLEDTMDLYNSGEIRVLIGTSHIYEGVDVPNLDAVVLSDIGKNSRKYIQGIGRALRSSKTGKFAHIIDFQDIGNPVLRKHSLERSKLFSDITKIGNTNIFNITPDQFETFFINFEKCRVNNL